MSCTLIAGHSAMSAIVDVCQASAEALHAQHKWPKQ